MPKAGKDGFMALMVPDRSAEMPADIAQRLDLAFELIEKNVVVIDPFCELPAAFFELLGRGQEHKRISRAWFEGGDCFFIFRLHARPLKLSWGYRLKSNESALLTGILGKIPYCPRPCTLGTVPKVQGLACLNLS